MPSTRGFRWRLFSFVLLALGSGLSAGVYAQTASAWYPVNPQAQYHVKNAFYDLRTNWGSQYSRIGMQFQEDTGGQTYYYYFSSSDATQVQRASALYGSLLAAMVSGSPAFVYVTTVDPYMGVSYFWDFTAVQVGSN
jgi:hypothetical protein